MKYFKSGAAFLLILCTTACAGTITYDRYGFPRENAADGRAEYAFRTPPMNPNRVISEQYCGEALIIDGKNLRCVY